MNAAERARMTELEMRADLMEDRLLAVFRIMKLANQAAGLPTQTVQDVLDEMTPAPPTKAERMEALGLSVVDGGAA